MITPGEVKVILADQDLAHRERLKREAVVMDMLLEVGYSPASAQTMVEVGRLPWASAFDVPVHRRNGAGSADWAWEVTLNGSGFCPSRALVLVLVDELQAHEVKGQG